MKFVYYLPIFIFFTIYAFNFCVYWATCSSEVESQNHLRQKRLYDGLEADDKQFPFIVFLKILINDTDVIDEVTLEACVIKYCTGTLIHRRFVLTSNYCVPYYFQKVSKTQSFM